TAAAPERILIVLTGPEGAANTPDWVDRIASPGDTIYLCETRGHGETRWSRKTPPNRVERAHVLVGTTVDAGRVLDAISAARYARGRAGNQLPVYLAGQGAAGIIAAYAAFWDREAIGGAVLLDPPLTHMSKAAPVF